MREPTQRVGHPAETIPVAYPQQSCGPPRRQMAGSKKDHALQELFQRAAGGWATRPELKHPAIRMVGPTRDAIVEGSSHSRAVGHPFLIPQSSSRAGDWKKRVYKVIELPYFESQDGVRLQLRSMTPHNLFR